MKNQIPHQVEMAAEMIGYDLDSIKESIETLVALGGPGHLLQNVLIRVLELKAVAESNAVAARIQVIESAEAN